MGSEAGANDGATLPAGATVSLIARTAASDWLQVQRNDGSTAWLPRTAVVAFGVEELPVFDAESEPTETVAEAIPEADESSAEAQVTADTPAIDTAPTTEPSEESPADSPAV